MARAHSDSATKAPPRSGWRRAFELCGVVPLLAFVVLHMVDAWRDRPLAQSRALWLELTLVWLPLSFHLVYAIVARVRGRGARGPSRSIAATSAAWGSAAFLALHLWHVSVPVWRGLLGRAQVRDLLVGSLASTVAFGVPVWALAYCLGVAAVSLHVVLGTLHYLEAEGVLARPLLKRRIRAGVWVLGLAVFLSGFDALSLLATGTHFWLAAPG